MRRSTIFVTLLAALGGCGGKIVETAPMPEPNVAPPSHSDGAKDGTKTEQTLVPSEPAGSPAPTSTTPLDACEILCERDARCDTTLPALPVREDETGDCKARCEARLSEKNRCGIEEWLFCYAASVDPHACTPLPADCRPAFCAWARCAKEPISNCE